MTRLSTREASVHDVPLEPCEGTLIEDPISMFGAFLTKSKTIWLRLLYPFAGLGHKTSIHFSCDICRSAANRIWVGDSVYLAKGTWLNIPEPAVNGALAIILGNGCKIGRRSTISARNLIRIEQDVLFAPHVLVMDHSHEYSNVNSPIHSQGVSGSGSIVIERNCWIGYGAVIIAGDREVRIGRNTVIGAHSIIRKSVPPYSVVVGNPATVVKQYDPNSCEWKQLENRERQVGIA